MNIKNSPRVGMERHDVVAMRAVGIEVKGSRACAEN